MSHHTAIDENYIKIAQIHKVMSDKLNESESVVEEILQNGNAINYQVPANDYFAVKKSHLIGCTALHLALEKNKIQMFKRLLNHGADFMIQNGNGETLLHLAVKQSKRPSEFWYMQSQSNKLLFIDSLLLAQIETKNAANLCNKDGLSHFHIACMRNNIQAVQLFLQNGVQINQAVNLDSSVFPGFTPLHFAAKYSALETTELLIMNDADASLKDADGLSPLHLILAENMKMLANNFKIDSDNDKKQKNIIEKNIRIINLLSSHIFADDLYKIDNIGLFQLHIVSTYQNTSLIEKMLGQNTNLNHSVNIDSTVWPGYTALHFAALSSLEVTILLLKSGADILAKDAKGVTPFDLCMKKFKAKDLYSIIMTQPAWKGIIFSDRETKLSELLYVMQDEKNFLDFLEIHSRNINICIPRNVSLWPGCSILHLAVMFNHKFDKSMNEAEEEDDSDDPDYRPEEFGLKTIKKCLSLGADITVQDAKGTTPLHLAFRMQRKVLTELLLRDCPTKKNPIDEFGLSHLHIACASGFERLVKTFLDRKCGSKNINSAVVKSSFRWYQEDTCESSNCWMSRFLIVGSTPLHTVVSQGNNSLIRVLLRKGADIYAKDCNGITPVHQSLSANFSESHILRDFFITKDLRNSVADCGLSHLHMACYVDNADVVRRLLDQGADIEGVITYKRPADCNFKYNKVVQWDEFAMDDNRHRHYCGACDRSFNSLSYLSAYADCTPLMMAMKKDSDDVILLLVQRGADCLARKSDGSVLFYEIVDYHVRTGRCSWVPILLRHVPVQQRIEADIAFTQLHVACILLDIKMVQQLLASGFDSNARLNENFSMWPGYTALHLMLLPRPSAQREAVIMIIKMLLLAGADITTMNAQKETPIHFAINQISTYAKDPSVLEANSALLHLFLEHHKNFNLDVFSSRKVSHFHVACMINKVKIVHKFLLHGADVNYTIDHFDDEYGGFTALHLACLRQCKETVNLLLQFGANASAKDSLGNTPLHIIVRSWHWEIFNELLSAGADVNARNLLSETPFEIFLKSDKVTSEVIQLFLKYNCRVHTFNPLSGKGMIGLAFQKNHKKIEMISEDSIYNVVVCASDVQDVDYIGRTPIHNLVSVDERDGSMRPFLSPCVAVSESIAYIIEVLHGFESLGHDIDHQDAKGWTALHAAIPFDNRVGIMALLSSGADMNICDINGDSPYMFSFEHSKSKMRRDVKVLEFFFMHVRKLELFGLYISKENRDIDALISQERSYYSHNKLNFDAEVEQARTTYFGSYPITLYDFLSETKAVMAYPTMPKSQRQIIDQVFQNQSDYLRKEFRGLVGLFQLQYRKALARDDLIKSATNFLNCIAKVELPFLCLNIIFKYLANDDLKNLIRSDDQGIKSRKRPRIG